MHSNIFSRFKYSTIQWGVTRCESVILCLLLTASSVTAIIRYTGYSYNVVTRAHKTCLVFKISKSADMFLLCNESLKTLHEDTSLLHRVV